MCLKYLSFLSCLVSVPHIQSMTYCVEIQSNLLSKYLEGHTKSVFLIRGTYVLAIGTGRHSVHKLGTE